MNKKEELVSIVVPIYKVEQYLEKCVNSLVNQSYKNLEIILVDDGSPDNSGEIADKLQKKDPRIRVFHKENGGLSSARNFGLEKSTGKYICFIDSDDYIAPIMIECMMNNLLKTDAEVSICGIFPFKDGEEIQQNYKKDCIEIDTNEALLKMIDYNSSIAPNAINKIYKKSLFSKDCMYPVGKLYEDMGVTAKIFMKCKKIVYTTDKYYFYYQRENSITNTTFNEKDLDHIYMSEELYNNVVQKLPHLKNEFKIYHIFNRVGCCNKIILLKDKKYEYVIDETKKEIKDNIHVILNSKVYNFKKKIQLVLLGYFTLIYKFIYRRR